MALLPDDLLDHARRLLEEATKLADIPHRDAVLRAVVNRAYYACFHVARRTMVLDGVDFVPRPTGLGSHEAIWGWWFGDVRANPEIAQLGFGLRDLRTIADYRLGHPITLAAAKGAVADAEALFRLLRTVGT